MNIKEILNLWSFLGNYEIKAAKDGTNNSLYFVDSQGGQFILKIYGNSTKTEQIEYEHSLLSYLSSQNISFQISKPIPNNSGETILQIERNNIPLRVSLFAKIEGQNLDRNNLLQTRSAGKALGELQLACANFAPKIDNLPSWGDLYNIHPSVKKSLRNTAIATFNSKTTNSFARYIHRSN